ncbi:MAG: response regulator [Pseudomonadales bacterium]
MPTSSSKTGMQGKLLTVMTLLIFALLIASIGLSTFLETQKLTTEMHRDIAHLKSNLSKKGQLLTNLAADSINVASTNIDKISLRAKLNAFVASDEDLKYIILMDKERLAFVHTLQPSLQNKTLNDRLSQHLAMARKPGDFEHNNQGNNYLEFLTPLGAGKTTWGVLRLGFSLTSIDVIAAHKNSLIKQSIFEAVLQLILLAIIFMTVAWYSSRKISLAVITPLRELTYRVNDMTSGNYLAHQETINPNNREIAELNNALRRLSRRLDSTYNEFKTYNHSLEQQVEEQSAELAVSKNQADKYNTSKSEFLTHMGHEVRTPMNAVIGLTHLLKQTPLTHRQQDYTRKIITSGETLLTVISDMLDFSKIDSGMLTLEKQSFDLDEVLTNVIQAVVPRAHEKGLELMVDVKPEVPGVLIGDAARLQQIFTNLLNNAIQHTECGDITLSVDVPENPRNQQILLNCKIVDSGIGMTDEQKNSLFDAFASPDLPITRSYNNSGLGLTICKKLIEMMDGQIWANSIYGIGSEFIFLARFGLPAHNYQKKQLKFPKNACSILLVDNHTRSSAIMTDMLSQLGLKVTCVESTQHAFDDISHASNTGQPYQLVIMKADMPQISGTEAANHIKTQLHLNKAPQIILISKATEVSEHTSLLNNSIDNLLVAPITASQLRSAITTLLTSPFNTPRPSHQNIERESHMLAGKHILVTEDNDINQQVIGELLASIGVQVSFANNGQEALDLLLDTTPIEVDGILMDLQMPKMDGYEATQRLRSDPRYQELPIIGLTAHASTAEHQRCLDKGMQEHLSKPIDPDLLFSTLSRFILPKTKQSQTGYQLATQENSNARFIDDLQQIASNSSFYIKIAKQFIEQHSDADNRIRQQLVQQQHENAQRLVTSLRHAASAINITSLEQSACALEDSIKQHQPDEQVAKRLDRFSKTLQASLERLAHTIAQLKVQESKRSLEEKQTPAPLNKATPAKILVVDDDTTNLEVLKEQLLLIGYESELTNNGAEAWEKWQANTYHLVLTDISMPTMDGYELTRRIRASEPANNQVPIIAFTASSSKSDMNRCLEIGMNDFLIKPMALDDLQQALNKWLPLELSTAAHSRVATESAPQNIPSPNDSSNLPVDISTLIQLVGNNPVTHRSLLNSFTKSATQTLEELNNAAKISATDTVSKQSHKLKSAARNMGAVNLASVCQALERACIAGQHDKISALLENLNRQFKEVREFIAHYLKTT